MPKPPPPQQPVPLGPILVLAILLAPIGGAAWLIYHREISTAAGVVSATALVAALIIPAAAYIFGRSPRWWATRVWFWSWNPDRTILGICTAATIAGVAITFLAAAGKHNPVAAYYGNPLGPIVATAAGVAVGHWVFFAARLRLRRLTRDRLLPDETLTARVARAIRMAEAVDATRSVGVALDTARARPTVTEHSMRAPHRVGDNYAYAVINRDRLITRDHYRILNGWTDPSDRWLVLPDTAGAMRALVIAGTGSGKTFLLFGQMLCAAGMKWPCLFIDLKGDPDDADKLVDNAKARPPHSQATLLDGGFRFFDTPTVGHLRDRILALFPPAMGADRYYENRRAQILGYVLDDNLPTPVRSLDDIENLFRRPDTLPDPDRARQALTNPTKTGSTDGQEVLNEIVNAIRSIRGHISTDPDTGWNFRTISTSQRLHSLRLYPATNAIDKTFAGLLLVALRQHMEHRMRSKQKDTPFLCVIDEFPQMTGATDDAATTATMLYETARSANIGLILAGQTIAGFSNDTNTQERLVSAGQAVILGRTNDPERIVELAGTTMHLESSADPEGGLKSSRAQHTYRIHPDDVRSVEIGGFWIIADGTTRRFNALP